MAGTVIASNSAQANKKYSVGLFTATQRRRTLMKNLAAPMPSDVEAGIKLRGQSSPDMPIVTCNDLNKAAGDRITVDLVNIVSGKPVMGERTIEGKGDAMSFSSMEVVVDQTRKAVGAGGKMTQQRTPHDLRKLAVDQLYGYTARLEDQLSIVHMAGARGDQTGLDWVIPTTADADFADIVVNTVKAPTYNRHFVVDSTNLIQGGAQLGSIDSADFFTLNHIDAIRSYIDDLDLPLQPILIKDDPAAVDEPLFVLGLSPKQYSYLLTSTAGQNIRAFQQNAWNRKSYGSKSPLFSGEVGIWNGILVKKMSRSVRFLNGNAAVKHITVANRYTETESNATIAVGAGFAVDRAILMGAQGLIEAFGKNTRSNSPYNWSEKELDHGDKWEVALSMIGGKAKVRFGVNDGAGNVEPTDHGIIVIDSTVKL